MQDDAWFVLDKGDITGPYTAAQIEEFRATNICKTYNTVSQDRRNWIAVDDFLRVRRAKAAQPKSICPPPINGIGGPLGGGRGTTSIVRDNSEVTASGLLMPFPIAALIPLHFLTGGIFTFFWITAIHGKLPRIRSDDPSTMKAIGLCFVPFYNLYWFFIVYPRLGQRLNAMSRQYSLPPAVPDVLAYIICIIVAVPVAMATAGNVILMILLFSNTSKDEVIWIFLLLPNILTMINFLFMVPIWASLVQQSVNRISAAQIVQHLSRN